MLWWVQQIERVCMKKPNKSEVEFEQAVQKRKNEIMKELRDLIAEVTTKDGDPVTEGDVGKEVDVG